jgi:glucose/arabinose dehydrogenase
MSIPSANRPALAQAETPTAVPTEQGTELVSEHAEAPALTEPMGISVAPVATPGGDLPGDVSIQLVKVADGLIDPINVASPGDGSGRLFVVERPGRIRIVQEGQVLEEPFLNISGQVLSAFLEQGLYDMTFHPDFASNGLFYVHFAELMRNGDSMIVQYQVSANDPNKADPESAKVILQIEQPFANHNGGELAFGPDGYLYIGSGDGGWEGDPLEAGQDLTTLLGKILRVDVNAGQPYAIPENNPFAQPDRLVELFGISEDEFARIHTEVRPEIWAYGLRNPWKFNFDPETGDLYIADVGQNQWEEIDFQPANSLGGENYGWDFLNGSHCFPVQAETCDKVGVLPVAEYSHDLGHAIVGIGVYRGQEFPELNGIYFAGDWESGRIWGLARDETGVWVFQELLDTALQLTGSGQDETGSLYVTSCNCNYEAGIDPAENPPGSLWRLVSAAQASAGTETAPLGESE